MLTIAPYIAWNNVEGELALFDSRDGTYHALNGPAAAIWRAIGAGWPPDEIVDRLASRYVVPREAVERDVSRFMERAVAKGLLVAAGQSR